MTPTPNKSRDEQFGLGASWAYSTSNAVDYVRAMADQMGKGQPTDPPKPKMQTMPVDDSPVMPLAKRKRLLSQVKSRKSKVKNVPEHGKASKVV